MALTEKLYEAAKSGWDAQLEHPFVKGLGDGSLEEERFKRWVLQDYRYLKESSRVFAWAVAKADSLDQMGWYAAVLDLTLTTRAYTDFLVRTAADGDMADLLAALLPCAWGYVYIGRKLAEGNPPDDQRYSDWIAQYASDEFAQANDWLKAELDRVAAGASDDKVAKLTELFLTSSRYEWLFWEMCWQGESWPV